MTDCFFCGSSTGGGRDDGRDGGRDGGRGDVEVETFGEEGEAIWTKVFEEEGVEVISTKGRGIGGYCYKSYEI